MAEHIEIPLSRPTHPLLFAVMVLPFSAAVGFLQVAVPYSLRSQGVSLAAIAALSGTAFYPMALKILWVPLIDLAPRRRRWYVASALTTAFLLAGCVLVPDPSQHLVLFTLLLTGAEAAAATMAASLYALMATTTRVTDKGKAGGYYMAGNVGGTGILGALPIWLTGHHFSPTQAGSALVGICVLAMLPIFWVQEVHAPREARDGSWLRAAQGKMGSIGRDVWSIASSREGLTGLLICGLPIGCGALTNLFSGMAPDYHASEHTVELVTGLIGGLVGAAGSIVGGQLADRVNRRLVYVTAGCLTGLCAVGMALSPMNAHTYTWGALAYSFCNGIAFAAFAGLVLEMVSHGAAVATKYNLFVAVSNQAIAYTTFLDGRASLFRHGGTVGTVWFDAILTFTGAGLLGLILLVSRGKRCRFIAEAAR